MRVIKGFLLAISFVVVAPFYVLWELLRFLRKRWKTLAILVLSFINIVSFLAACNTRAVLEFEMRRLIAVDNAQRFANRALGLAEMEAMRADDLQASLNMAESELEILPERRK